jgi:hypothetical protein
MVTIIAGEHSRFDYLLKPGPVTRSNAIALMRAVGLDVKAHSREWPVAVHHLRRVRKHRRRSRWESLKEDAMCS